MAKGGVWRSLRLAVAEAALAIEASRWAELLELEGGRVATK